MRRIIWSRVIVGLLVGCAARMCIDSFKARPEPNIKILGCSPCEDPQKVRKEPCPFCGSKRVAASDKKGAALEPYKPKGMYEITRWLYFNEEYMYDIIDGAPDAKLVGGKFEETKAITQVALEYINENKMLGKTWELVSLQNGYMRTDVLRGTDYVLDLNVKSVEKYISESVQTTLRVKMVHPFENDKDSLSLVDRYKMPDVGIHIICYVSANEETMESFVKRYIDTRSEKDSLTLVLFEGQGRFGEESITLLPYVHEIINRFPSSRINFIEVAGNYDYLNALHQAGKAFKDSIILTLTLDMHYGQDLLQSCRLLALPQKRVYFPTAFSQYDPDVIERGMPTGKPKNINKMDINKFTGYWMHENFDYLCAHSNDLKNAVEKLWLSTQRTQKSSISKLDVGKGLYDLFLAGSLDVISCVEPDLRKLFRKNRCSVRFMNDEEYKQCFNGAVKTLGSKPALSMVYLTEIVMQKL